MSKYNDQVTILSPTYLSGKSHSQTGGHTHSNKPQWYKKVFKSFYDSMKQPYPIHNIKDDSDDNSKKEFKNFLESINANYTFLGGKRTNGFTALIRLLESIETPYFFFVLDDTMLVKKKDFITPCIEAMNNDDTLAQIKLGCGFVCHGRTNKDIVKIHDNGTASPIVAPNSIYTPEKLSTGDVVWKMSLNHKNILNVFPLSYHNCFMRTSFAMKIHKKIMEKKDISGNDFSDYLIHTNYERDTCNKINKNGWPKGFEFIEEYKNGWLNFASYLYPIGRLQESEDSFKKTHTFEIYGK